MLLKRLVKSMMLTLFRVVFLLLFVLFHCMTIKNLRQYNEQERNRCQHMDRKIKMLKSDVEYLQEEVNALHIVRD